MAGYTVGVDVGGTKILAAVVAADETVVARAKVNSPTDTSDALMNAVKGAIRDAVTQADLELDDIDGIGLGVPGVVGARGECIWAPNCPLTGVPVADIIAGEFGKPVAVGNDVNTGTLGEKAFGAARQFQNVFGMFVGTGIGGGLVVDGKVIVGDHCLGAEIGHILIDFEAAIRGDEGGGEFEYYASRLGIERAIRAGLAAGRESAIGAKLGQGDDRIRSGALKKALAANDALVTEVMARTAQILGIATVTVIHLVDPEAIVFGGGVIEACGDFLLPRIEQAVAEHVAPGNGQPMRIIRSALGDDAVLLGAVALVKQTMEAPAGDHRYPRIAIPEFGVAQVDGEDWDRDLVVRADGRVKKRKKRLSRKVHGTAHELSVDEIKDVCKLRPEQLFIGAGHHGQVVLSNDASEWLAGKGIAVTVQPTPLAAQAFNQATGTKALLLHVTC